MPYLYLSSNAAPSSDVQKLLYTSTIPHVQHTSFLHQRDLCLQAHNLWVLPFQIGLALVILYSVVGLATLTGLLTMTVIMLLCVFIAGKQQAYTVKIMACKDVRIKVTNEAITNMKIIKLQAWQDRFLTKVAFELADLFRVLSHPHIFAYSMYVLISLSALNHFRFDVAGTYGYLLNRCQEYPFSF